MTPLEFTLIGLAAVMGGAVNALAGGGTLITFPMLTALGIPPVSANITNTVALCPGYLGGTIAQLKDLRGYGRKLWLFGPLSVLGGIVGGILLIQTGDKIFRSMVPFLILFAAGLLAVQDPLRRYLTRHSGEHKSEHLKLAWLLAPVGLAAIYGGYFGAGLSVIILAVLGLVLNDSLIKLNAMKQVLALCVNIAAALFFLFSGKVLWAVALVMAVGSLLGGALGGRLACRMKPAVLRRIVVVIGVIVGVIYLVH